MFDVHNLSSNHPFCGWQVIMDQAPLYFYFVTFFAGLLLSLLITPMVRRFALTHGRVAVPGDDRWHRKETALLGGTAIFSVMMTVWALAAGYIDWATYGMPYLPVILCGGGMFALGLADDLFGMDPQNKLAGQIIITSVLMFFGFRLGWTDSRTINLFLSILWIVGITNAFNLLDNMDGLSAGIAFIGGGFLLLTLYLNPNGASAGPVLIMGMAYLGAVFGFLVYNFNPASIFMGDAGSLFIGFMLACLSVIGGPRHIQGENFIHVLSVVAIPVFILFIPILDTGFVSLMRKLFRRPISMGGRDHSSHRMVAIGFSEKKAVVMLYGFSMASGLIALAINYFSFGTSLVVSVLFLLFVLFFWIFLAKVKVYSEKSVISDPAPGVLTPVLIRVTHWRRLLEVILDLVLITVAYYSAYLLRFEGAPGENSNFFLQSLPIMIACQILCFFMTGIYRGVWKKTVLRDLIDYFKAITISTVTAMLILLFIYRFQSFSRAVFVIYWGVMLILVCLSRLSFRLFQEGARQGNNGGEPTLIYGAGVGGEMGAKEIEANRGLGLTLIGFIDDDPYMHRRKIMGYPVFGGQKVLSEIINKHQIKEIIISFKENGGAKKKEIRNLCLGMGADVEVRQMKIIMS